MEHSDKQNLEGIAIHSLAGIAIHAPQISAVEALLLPEPLNLRLNSEVRGIISAGMNQQSMQRFAKRFLDILLTGSALIALSPFFLLTAALIAWDSKGPVFFSQTRVGKEGRLFKLYKFRTMVANAEELKAGLLKLNEVDGPAFKIRNDPRVTRIGRFLRKTSLDELPQLWNVLVGDMSLVGPRPALPNEVMQWESWQFGRLAVDQGCTCIWQVSGRNNLSFQEWMRMDMDYVSNWSLFLDLRLIVRTIVIMITGKGAY